VNLVTHDHGSSNIISRAGGLSASTRSSSSLQTRITTRSDNSGIANIVACLKRTTVAEIIEYRAHVDAGMARLLDSGTFPAAVVELGMNHEPQACRS